MKISPPLKSLDRIRDALQKSKIDDVVGAVLSETPLGKIGRMIEKLSDILGTDSDEDSVLEAIEAGIPPEQAIAIREFALREREALEETRRSEIENLTSRHAADMMADSLLSKTVRPIVTYILLGSVLLDSISVRLLEAKGIETDASQTLSVLMQMAIGFYFGSRGIQHVVAQFASKWNGTLKS